MHLIDLPGDINSYRVNEQGKYQTNVLQIFLTIFIVTRLAREDTLQPIH